jgi:hypothetical protein
MGSKGGILYISIPIEKQNEILLKAHWVFSPTDILTWCLDMLAELARFDYVESIRGLVRDARPTDVRRSTAFGLGIYTFKKKTFAKF